MFNIFTKTDGRSPRTDLFGGIMVAMLVLLARQAAQATPDTVNLGSASSFAVLAGSGISVAGAVNSTSITGDIGSSPTATITGLGNVGLTGVDQAGDATAIQAQSDLANAYNTAVGFASTTTYAGGFDLGGSTLGAGVYNDASSLGLTGTLTLNGDGNPNAIWIIQIGSTLITAANSQVVLENGAQAQNVFWVVGSSATLGTDTTLMGNILAWQSITLTTGVTVDGRLLAANGAVTLAADNINILAGNAGTVSVPDGSGTGWLLGIGVAVCFVGRRYFSPSTKKLAAGI